MKSLLFTGLVAAATISSNVSAGFDIGDVITVSRLGTSPSRAIRYDYNASRSYDAAVTGAGTFGLAGRNSFEILAGGFGNIGTFCVEMNEGFVDDPIDYTVVSIADVPEESFPGSMNSARQTLVKDLYARWYNQTAYSPGDDWTTVSNYNAAFQLVIWEISHENIDTDDASVALSRLNISEGAMAFTDTYDDAVANIANNIILSLGTGGFMEYHKLRGLTNPNNQDMLIVVPTPAIAGLAGLGLVGMRRRRR